MGKIRYRRLRPYKYQLMEAYTHQTGLEGQAASTQDEWVQLKNGGELVFRRGYAWDGPSGPTVDTKNFMRGSLVHDGLYQLMRESLLGQEHRKYADELLRDICRKDGMSRFRSWYVYRAVRAFAGRYAAPSPNPPAPVITAP